MTTELPSPSRRDVLIASAVVSAAALPSYVALAQGPGLTRKDLQRSDISIPGREAIQVLVGIAPGVVAPNHTHPGEELVYVVEGELEYTLEGKPPVTLKAGEVLFIPSDTPHVVKNVGSGNATELATYIVDKSRPLISLAK
jgi:quercetin dioxygenase-like cupin family protein